MTSPLGILRHSLNLYRANSQLIVGYASWLLLTAAAFVLVSFVQNDAARETLLLIVQVADLMLWLWVGIMVMRVAAVSATKTPVDPTALPRDAWTLLWPFAWVTALQGLAVCGGFLLFIVPGFVFLVWFALSQQALVIGNKHGLDALSESRDLCRGRFFTVAWYLFVGPFLTVFAYLVLLVAFFAIVAAAARLPINTAFGDQPPLWMDVTATVTEIFLMPILYIYWSLTYLELKEPLKTNS
jgi:hypothetical protein